MNPKHLYIASDHAGFELKSLLLTQLQSLPWVDLGPADADRVDYPDYADRLAQALLKSSEPTMGVLVCGSGQGMCMRANRYPQIRAALCWDEETARLARAHNNANVLCLGGRLIPPDVAEKILKAFVSTPFEGGRHELRVKKLSEKP